MNALRKGGQLLDCQFRFWKMWTRHQDFMFKVCLIYSNQNYHNAQDLFSEVKLKAGKRVQKEQTLINSRSWFSNLITSVHIDRHRKERKNKLKLVQVGDTKDNHWLNQISQITPFNYLLEQELKEYFKKSAEGFSYRHYHISNLYFTGFSYRDIADSFIISEESVRKIVQLSRKVLRKSLRNYHKDLDASELIGEAEFSGSKQIPHLFAYSKETELHYFQHTNTVQEGRLCQKEQSAKKYLARYEKSYSKKYELAEILCSQGKVNEALTILESLLRSGYHSKEVYNLRVILLDLLDRDKEIFRNISSALERLQFPSFHLYAWSMIVCTGYNKAVSFLEENLKMNPDNLDSHLLLVRLYIMLGNYQESYNHCLTINDLDTDNREVVVYQIFNVLKLKGVYKVKDCVFGLFESCADSPLINLYMLHFMNSGGQTGIKMYRSLFIKMQKKYFWHPDIALVKAMHSPEKATKILSRRCREYPDCVLSKYYLSQFTGKVVTLKKLNFQEQVHYSIIRSIYR